MPHALPTPIPHPNPSGQVRGVGNALDELEQIVLGSEARGLVIQDPASLARLLPRLAKVGGEAGFWRWPLPGGQKDARCQAPEGKPAPPHTAESGHEIPLPCRARFLGRGDVQHPGAAAPLSWATAFACRRTSSTS